MHERKILHILVTNSPLGRYNNKIVLTFHLVLMEVRKNDKKFTLSY